MTAAVLEFSRLLRQVAEPATPGELVSHAIHRAARRLGLSVPVARAYWYGQRGAVPSDLMDMARHLAAEPLVIEARNELAEIDARLARIEAILLQDTQFHGPAAAALREVARGSDRPLDRG